MSLLDFFKKGPKGEGDHNAAINAEASQLVDQLVQEALSIKDAYSLPPLSKLDAYQHIKNKPDSFKKDAIKAIPEKIAYFRKKMGNGAFAGNNYYSREILQQLFSQLVRGKLPYEDEELLTLVRTTVSLLDLNDYYSGIPFKPLLSKIEENLTRTGRSTSLDTALELLLVKESNHMYSDARSLNKRIRYLLKGTQDLKIDLNDQLGKSIAHYLDEVLEEPLKEKWLKLIDHLASVGDKAAPTKKWVQDTQPILQELGYSHFTRQAIAWLELCKLSIQQYHKNPRQVWNEGLSYPSQAYSIFLTDVNHNFLKALIWTAGTVNDPDLNSALDEYGQWALKKMPGVGVLSLKTGNACLYSFSILPFRDGISRLTKFRKKIKHGSVLKQIDKCIRQISEREGYSEAELEEMGVPDYGLDTNGLLLTNIGDYTAHFQITGMSSSTLSWEKEGKKQASVPAAIKTGEKEALSRLKKQIKEIEAQLPAQRDRIEQLYLEPRSIRYTNWESYYLNHPLVSILARKLIWHFSKGEQKAEGLYLDGRMLDVKGAPLDWLDAETDVQLWHPIDFEPSYVLEWRNLLLQRQIVQPFKQAFREVYLLTDAELNTRSYSNRFAAHVLRQHQFAALCKQRGWHYTLQGNWDSHNTPYVLVPHWNIRAEYFVDADGNGTTTESGIYNHIFTDQVRFYDNRRQLNMDEVPAMVFSEIMRDVDLFVGVTSIGNDPTWQDGGNDHQNTYWREYSFGDLSESAKIREDVLKNLIPCLKIASQCSFEGKFLKVRGELRDYKIHMGSGNILMSPNDQYLCIVPDRKTSKDEQLFLPFEGDSMLSIIISKAFLLAEDHKIKDPTIIRQLKL